MPKKDVSFSRRTFLGGSALALASGTISMPFVRTARAQAATFKAGVITSLSGENISGGNLTKNGYDLWAEAANKKGGVEVGGERFMVEMFYGDDQSNPATGADAAERLIVQNEVDFLLGPYTSGSTIAVQPICQKYQVPMISGSAELRPMSGWPSPNSISASSLPSTRHPASRWACWWRCQTRRRRRSR